MQPGTDVSPETRAHIQRTYRRFAEREAHGVSPLYEAFALAVAESELAVAFLAQMPRAKRQPNLLFGAVKYLFGVPTTSEAFIATLERHSDQIAEVMHKRRTQTNESARCAVLLPLLSQLPQPLALLEVGASAGLCLQPDRYRYR